MYRGYKTSRAFRQEQVTERMDKCIGSPSDIRKVMRYLHGQGYYHIVDGPAPVFREGRTYSIIFTAPECAAVGEKIYSVWRES